MFHSHPYFSLWLRPRLTDLAVVPFSASPLVSPSTFVERSTQRGFTFVRLTRLADCPEQTYPLPSQQGSFLIEIGPRIAIFANR